MKPTYIGYDPARIEEGDTVVSYPHHRTKTRLHGDIIAIDGRELRVNYNRTETSDGKMLEKACGVTIIFKECGTLYGNAEISTSLDIELIIKGRQEI